MNKILITGTHGVGKSTLALHLTALLKNTYRDKNVGIIQENIRHISNICNGELNTSKFQRLCIADTITQETLKQDEYDFLVCDRTSFDCMIYGIYFNNPIPKELTEECYNNLKSFKKVFFIRPDNQPIVNDGFRFTDPNIQKEIDLLFKKLLPIPYIEITSKDICSFNYIEVL